MSTNKFHGGNVTTEMNDVYQPMGVVMDHATKQPAGKFNQILEVQSSFSFSHFMRKGELAKLLGQLNYLICYHMIFFSKVVQLNHMEIAASM